MLALVTALLVLVGGCAHQQLVGSDRTVHVALSEYRLNPDNVRVNAGMLIIYVRNYGRLTHNLVISQNGQTAGSTTPLWPGQSAELALDLAPGTYSMASTILSDEALGAYGTLKVTP
jgi:plastocyanin